ncbi:hypothetical protein FO440_15095 [Mucilaginibacter corticis]|uniref:Uncharacterized protein n=1 Tax=Mucilaginibacter corticis TaxID=2597670 RepID=A0A556MM89_9SPHI|nr:hypothetical protein [Mucilaginibacter corticis]TSJ41054.1 hypothetical protein FO440_15095 [Mucilaginibacter corticis]
MLSRSPRFTKRISFYGTVIGLHIKSKIMANNENGAKTDRKGKPSGNGRENETLDEAINESAEMDALDTENTAVKHHNRHLHKGEDIKTFKDTEE